LNAVYTKASRVPKPKAERKPRIAKPKVVKPKAERKPKAEKVVKPAFVIESPARKAYNQSVE
jgi:hypothetical protein